SKKCHMVLCIRDLDGFSSQEHLVQARKDWFDNVCQNVSCSSVLLLNIWELEAFLLGDIDSFNRFYKSNLSYMGNPSAQPNPKEWLKSRTKKLKKSYKESDCPELFASLDYDKI